MKDTKESDFEKSFRSLLKRDRKLARIGGKDYFKEKKK